MHSKPVIAITLGDVCGVGPEIVARAVASPQVQNACRPLIVGRVDTLQRAEAVHQQPPLAWQAIDSPDDLPAANGVIPVYDPLPEHRLPDSVGVSANAGEAAYRYLLAAIALARQGVVDAIATAPLNKAALHAAVKDDRQRRGLPNRGQCLDRCGPCIKLASRVIRYPDRVDAKPFAPLCICGPHHSFDDERTIPGITQPFHIVPTG